MCYYVNIFYHELYISMDRLVSETAEQRVNHQNLLDAERRDELDRKNFNFLQIEKSTLRDLRRLIARSVPAAQVLILLGEKMNKSNAVVCSYKVLSEITGYSRTTLHNAIKLLESERWVQVVKIGTANAYIINSRVFWQDTGFKKRHASFHASIIATESEQDEGYIENWEDVELRKFPILSKNEYVLIHPNDDLPIPDQQELDV